VKVNIQPFAITAVPHAGFFALLCVRLPLSKIKFNQILKKNPIKFPPRSETTKKTIGRSNSLVHELSQTDVCNAGGILAHQMDVRVEDQCVD
jgi:hypothetical protein